ncbi:MAG: hypothetical protein M0P61_05955 [Ignavibacteriaceae bacterium]|jgi:hypothetical protein|nr:hypothetical protein [Ignavibacteriaceae bacterium]
MEDIKSLTSLYDSLRSAYEKIKGLFYSMPVEKQKLYSATTIKTLSDLNQQIQFLENIINLKSINN